MPALCQFVMEVDEMLFEAFAPKRLKNVLQHAKNLEVKPLRRFFGLDLSPVFKLLLTGLMIGLMAGLSIAPQTQYLRDAGDAMCGTRLDPCCYAMHLLLTRGACRRRRPAHLGVRHGQGTVTLPRLAMRCRASPCLAHPSACPPTR